MYRFNRYNLIRWDISSPSVAYKLFVRGLYDYVIVKEETSSSVTTRSYFIAAKGIEASWSNRASLTYSNDIQGRKLVNEGQNWLAANTGITFTGLLDEYGGAAAAYSLRKLSSSYSGDAVVVRRSSDNATQSIGFVNNELDRTTLNSFCSGANGFITTWFDQSGNGFNATQTTATDQPKIFDSVTGVVEINGKPSIDFTGTGHLETVDTGIDVLIEQIQIVAYNNSQITSTSSLQQLINTYGSAGFEGLAVGASTGALTNETFTILNNGTAREAITDIINVGSHLFTVDWNGSQHNIYLDSNTGNYISAATPVQLNSRRIAIGTRFGALIFDFQGQIQELILYASDQSSNRTGIETNINDFYNIY